MLLFILLIKTLLAAFNILNVNARQNNQLKKMEKSTIFQTKGQLDINGMIRQIVQSNPGIKWKEVSQLMKTKYDVNLNLNACYNRWKLMEKSMKILKPISSQAQTNTLLNCIEKYGNNWTSVMESFPNKSLYLIKNLTKSLIVKSISQIHGILVQKFPKIQKITQQQAITIQSFLMGNQTGSQQSVKKLRQRIIKFIRYTSADINEKSSINNDQLKQTYQLLLIIRQYAKISSENASDINETHENQMQIEYKNDQENNDRLFMEAYSKFDGNYQKIIQYLDDNQSFNTPRKVQEKLKTLLETSLYILQQLCKWRAIQYSEIIIKNKKLITNNIIEFQNCLTYEVIVKLLSLNLTKIISNFELQKIVEMVCLPFSTSQDKQITSNKKSNQVLKNDELMKEMQEVVEEIIEENKIKVEQKSENKLTIREMIRQKLRKVVSEDNKIF